MLRLDIGISAEGTAVTPVTAGAELVVRIFWTRTTKKIQTPSNHLALSVDNGRFTDTIQSFLQNLEAVNIEEHSKKAINQGFSLSQIRVGLGVNAVGGDSALPG